MRKTIGIWALAVAIAGVCVTLVFGIVNLAFTGLVSPSFAQTLDRICWSGLGVAFVSFLVFIGAKSWRPPNNTYDMD